MFDFILNYFCCRNRRIKSLLFYNKMKTYGNFFNYNKMQNIVEKVSGKKIQNINEFDLTYFDWIKSNNNLSKLFVNNKNNIDQDTK